MPAGLELCSVLADAVRGRAAHPAVLFGEQRISYATLQARAECLAGALWARGIRPGDRVALLGANRPEYLELLFAASRIGAALVPLNSRYGVEDLRYALHASGARLLFLASSFRKQDFETLAAAACDGGLPRKRGDCAALPNLEGVILLDAAATMGSVCYADLFHNPSAAPLPPSGDLAQRASLVLFTSGSSGVAKPVLLTQAQLIRAMTRVRERQGITADDRLLSFLPYFHVFGGAMSTLVPLLAGGTVVMEPAFDATETLAAAERHRCTVIYSVAPCYKAWFDHPAFRSYDLSALRTGICAAGSPAAAAMALRVRETLAPMHAHFGMTETAGVATMTLRGDSAAIATQTAGRPLPGVELAIFEPGTDVRLPDEREGELRIRADLLTPGYLDAPEATRRAFTADGWLRTGDRAWLGTDGCLRVLGRLDDRLRSGGENIDPLEVEQFLASHPAIERAFVVGVPDARLGEVPVAFVIARVGAAPAGEEAVRLFCRGRIADFKIPRQVYFVDDVPGGFHKVQRFRLRQDAVQRMEQALRGAGPGRPDR